MVGLGRLKAFVRRVIARQQDERELDDEVDSCLGILTERHMARGLSREQALRAARIELGDRSRSKNR